ncbi:MAG: hypothetical protein Q9159_001114 [Coniocarpon cinnabarinum]
MDEADKSEPQRLCHSPDHFSLGPRNAHCFTLNSLKAAGMDPDTVSDAGTHESLTDSTYEIISAANTRSSDDEDSHQDDSESLLSFEDSGPHDNVHIHRDDYVSPEASRAITPAPDDTEDDEGQASAPKSQTAFGVPTDMSYSELTENTVLQTPRASTNIDPSALEAGNSPTEVSRTVDSSTTFLQDGIKLGPCHVSLRRTLAPSKLEVGPTFRILWHGDNFAQDAVVEKIAEALAVSTDTSMDSSITKESSTRFSIVQLSSFGSGTSTPQVTLIPTAKTEVIVDACSACSCHRFKHARPRVHHQQTQGSTETADLEVFFFSPVGSWSTQFDDIRPYTTTPYLDIRPTTSMFNLQPFRPFEGKAVHMHIDVDADTVSSKGSFPWRPITVPIDLEHFQHLDPELLNRNLQCMQEAVTEKPGLWHNPHEIGQMVTSAVQRARDSPVRKWLSRLVSVMLLYALLLQIFTYNTPEAEANSAEADVIEPMTVTVTSTVRSTVTSQVSEIPRLGFVQSAASGGPQMTPVVSSTTEVGAPLGAAHPPMVLNFELLRTDEGQLYLKLPHEMAKLRRPPPINVTAHSGYRTLDTTLSRWNASVYALSLKGFNPSSDPVTIVVDSQKASGVRQVLHYDPRDPYDSARLLESSLMACLETTKDVARLAQKELGVFRDQASGVILSSTDWLQEHLQTARKSGGVVAHDLWDRLAARREVLSKHAGEAGQDLVQHAQKQAGSMSSALSQQASALSKDIQRSINDFHDVFRQHLESGLRKNEHWFQGPGWQSSNPITEARRRLGIIHSRARNMMSDRRQERKARRQERKQARLMKHCDNVEQGASASSLKAKRHQAKCAKARKDSSRSGRTA